MRDGLFEGTRSDPGAGAPRPGPRVVACVATRNGAVFISHTLATLAAQTYPNLQILVSDDASTDDTAALCLAYANRDPRFQVVRQTRRLGWVGNVNALLGLAQGDYIFLMPHDDRLRPTYVTRLVEALETHPAAVLAFSGVETLRPNGRRAMQAYTDLDGVRGRVSRGRRLLRRKTHWPLPYRGLVRAAAVDRVGGLRTHRAGELGADWSWLVHLALVGPFVRVPDVLYQRVRRSDSLSHTWDHSVRNWTAAALACGAEINRSHLSVCEKAILQGAVVGACGRSVWRGTLLPLRTISRRLLRVMRRRRDRFGRRLRKRVLRPAARRGRRLWKSLLSTRKRLQRARKRAVSA